MTTTKDCIDQIPEPMEIRERLAKTHQEARILRGMLKVAEQRQRMKAANGDGTSTTEDRTDG